MSRLALALLLPLAALLAGCPQSPPPRPLPPLASCTPTPEAFSVPQLPPSGSGDFAVPYVPGELLVLPGGLTPQGLVSRVPGAELQAALPGGFLRLRVPEGQERAKAEALLRAGAQAVQPNYLYFPLYAPNDPLYPQSPADPARLQPFYARMGLETTWDQIDSLGCTPVVAVLDTAFNPEHPDLRGQLLPGKNLTPDGLGQDDLSPSPPPSGTAYQTGEPDHGQGVAGLVAATADNALGIPGVGLNRVRVLPLKVFYWVNGQYSSTSALLASAIRLATDLGANVINLSLGSPVPLDPVVQQALGYAIAQGTLPVAAAGNAGQDGLYYPARYPGVLAVGSVTLTGARSDFSNYATAPADLVMAAAGNQNPSERLWSLALGAAYPSYRSPAPYLRWAGTSFAAPQVSAVAALYVARYAARYGQAPSPSQVRLCLEATASNRGQYEAQTGYGIVRADRAMVDTTYCFP